MKQIVVTHVPPGFVDWDETFLPGSPLLGSGTTTAVIYASRDGSSAPTPVPPVGRLPRRRFERWTARGTTLSDVEIASIAIHGVSIPDETRRAWGMIRTEGVAYFPSADDQTAVRSAEWWEGDVHLVVKANPGLPRPEMEAVVAGVAVVDDEVAEG